MSRGGLGRAMFAGAVEGKLMGSHLETFVRQFGGLYLFLAIEQDVINAVAAFADEMLMPLHQRIEMLRAPAHQNLKSLIGDQFLQVTINCSETDARHFLAYLFVNLIRRRMRLIILDSVPDNFKLFGFSRLFSRFGHSRFARSSARDFCTSRARTALAV